MPNVLSIVGLKKYFPVKGVKKLLRAVDGVTVEIKKGETFSIVGESGSGKSTLGRTVLGLYSATDGEVLYRDTDIWKLRPLYVQKILKNAYTYRKKYAKLTEKGEPLNGKIRTAARVLGGLLCVDEQAFEAGLYSLQSGDKRLLLDVKRRYAGNEEFQNLDALLDSGVDITELTEKELRSLRKDLQIVFQDPYSSLDPRMTVGQIVAEGAVLHGVVKKDELQKYVADVLQACGLPPQVMHRYPHQFSGGQRQRVCIARALALKPKLIVCDECVSALDVSVQAQILNLLSDLKKERGLTYLFISHDLSVVEHISDRIAVLYLGKIVELGTSEQVMQEPRHPYTVALAAAAPKVQGEGELLPLPAQIEGLRETRGCPFAPRCFMAQEKCFEQVPPFADCGEGHFAACHFAGQPTLEKKERLKSAQKGE
jgi:peptide/nickel transport system ATP-binding protein